MWPSIVTRTAAMPSRMVCLGGALKHGSRCEMSVFRNRKSARLRRRAVETRITQEALRRHVLRVLRCWRERYVFSDEFLNGLQVLRKHLTGRCLYCTFSSAMPYLAVWFDDAYCQL